MPFEIVLGDIINMQADAIVTAADTEATIRSGADAEIYNKAGPKLSEARKKIGPIAVGQTAVTPAFDLNAEYIIHAVVPVRQGGLRNEETLLSRCYKEALILAKENHCDSIAFPLLSAENNVFSKSLALQIAIREFRNFLMENDMQIYLVVSDRDDFLLSEKLFRSVADYIDETYGKDKTLDEYGITDKENVRENELLQIRRETKYRE